MNSLSGEMEGQIVQLQIGVYGYKRRLAFFEICVQAGHGFQLSEGLSPMRCERFQSNICISFFRRDLYEFMVVLWIK